MEDHVLSIDIMVPVEKVWEELTKTGSIQRAMYNTVLESDLVPGAKLRYYSPDKKRVFVVGEVVDIEPPRKLVHTYVMTHQPEAPTTVTWELMDIAGGCRVTLTHSGWTAEAKTYKNVKAGWEEILELMKHDLETGTIPLKTRMTYKMMSLFMFMMPKSTTVGEVEKAGW